MFTCENCGIEMDESIFGPICPHPPIRGSEFTKSATYYRDNLTDKTLPIDLGVIDVFTVQAQAQAAAQRNITEPV